MESIESDTDMESLEPDRDMMMDPSGKLQYFWLNVSSPAHSRAQEYNVAILTFEEYKKIRENMEFV